ncbi:MAG: CDP-alcohol phosphatidyltransferase family protein [Candidatus Hodarchaeota archaeon]
MSSQKKITEFSRSNKVKSETQSLKKEDITCRFMQKISMPIARFIYPFGFITPNQITWFHFFLCILGSIILIIAEENIVLLFLVGFCFWLSALIDGLDGQLARLRGTMSKKGEWLDRVLDEGKGYPFFIALGIHIQDSSGNFTLYLLGDQLVTLNVWFTMTILFFLTAWLSIMTKLGSWILREPILVSNGNVYITWIFLIFNLLDWFFFLLTIGTFLAVVWKLIEKTFIEPANPPAYFETIENE